MIRILRTVVCLFETNLNVKKSVRSTAVVPYLGEYTDLIIICLFATHTKTRKKINKLQLVAAI